MDVEEVNNLVGLCLKIIDRDGIDFFRPVACVPSTKQLAFMMERRGLIEADVVRAWAFTGVSNDGPPRDIHTKQIAITVRTVFVYRSTAIDPPRAEGAPHKTPREAGRLGA